MIFNNQIFQLGTCKNHIVDPYLLLLPVLILYWNITCIL